MQTRPSSLSKLRIDTLYIGLDRSASLLAIKLLCSVDRYRPPTGIDHPIMTAVYSILYHTYIPVGGWYLLILSKRWLLWWKSHGLCTYLCVCVCRAVTISRPRLKNGCILYKRGDYIYIYMYKTWKLSLGCEVWQMILEEIKTRCFHYITGVVPHEYTLSRNIPRWYPKVCVYGTQNLELPVLLDVGASVRWLETGMSTRLWTICSSIVTRACTQRSSRGSQSIRSSIAETLLVRP